MIGRARSGVDIGLPWLEEVGGALGAVRAAVRDVCVEHRCLQVAVPEELLDGADVRARFEQVGREGVAEGGS